MHIALKVLLPMAGCGILILALVGLGEIPASVLSADRQPLLSVATIAVALMLVAAGFVLHFVLSRPLGALLQRVGANAGGVDEPIEFGARGDELAQLATRVMTMEKQVADRRRALDDAIQDRLRLEADLRLSEERYVLAVRGANDGLWEWQPASDEMYFSPRWKSMLGYTEQALPDTRQAWRECVLPDDLAQVESALAAHLQGTTLHFEQQFRVRHKHGETRWLLSRGAAVRHANGTPYRMVGLDTDVTRIKRIEAIVNEVAEGTTGRFGEEFFQSLVRCFASALRISCAFVTECANYPTTRLRTLAFWTEDGFQSNFEYDLANTPCDYVIREGKVCFLPKDVGKLFPCEEGYEGYLGLSISCSDGRVIGHIAFLDRKPMSEDMLLDSIYRIFAARAGAELERMWALEALNERERAFAS